MLTVDRLSKEYPTSRGPLKVLADVSFSLSAGDVAAVTGPSGSGKSSLLYILGALEPPSSGTVAIDGVNPFLLDSADIAAFRNRSVGFVFQDHCLLPQLTLLENVLIPTLVSGRNGDERERAAELVARVGLSDRLDHRPGELSGGERQRVAIARALVRSPKVVLCDEPTGNLDRAAADGVASLLLDLAARDRTTMVIVTHSAALAEQCPTRFEIVNRGLRRS